MKKLLVIFALLPSLWCFGQKIEDMALFRRTVIDGDYRCELNVYDKTKTIKTETHRHYTWIEGNKVFTTQGSYSGILLDGEFAKYNREGALIERGNYRQGEKDGAWFYWTEEGVLQLQTEYKRGVKDGSEIVYDIDGIPVESTSYKGGIPHGTHWRLNPDGSRDERKYVMGEEEIKKEKVTPIEPEIVPLEEKTKEVEDSAQPKEEIKTKKKRKNKKEPITKD